MITHPGFEFIVDKQKNSIHIKREFAAELPVIWDAYTKSEILDQWWAPKPWKARTKVMDFKEGGHWHYAMVGPEGEEHWCWLGYIKIDHQKKFDAFDAFADANGHVNTELPQANWSVSFSGKGDSTLVESLVVYKDLAQLETILQMGIKEGLTIAMEGLDALLPELKS